MIPSGDSPQSFGEMMFSFVGAPTCSEPGPWQLSQPIEILISWSAESPSARPTQSAFHEVSPSRVRLMISNPLTWQLEHALSHDFSLKVLLFRSKNLYSPRAESYAS